MPNRRMPKWGYRGKPPRTLGTEGDIDSENLQGKHTHEEAYMLKMANHSEGSIPQSSLVMHLDAGNTNSYTSGSNVWYDLTSNNRDWNVNSGDYNSGSGGHFVFSDGGQAMRSSDVSVNTSGTSLVVFLKWRTSDSGWRTLVRGNSYDHHIIVQSSDSQLGMYDNNGAGFIGSGYSIKSFDNWNTKFNMYVWKLKNSANHYQCYQNKVSKATINNGSAALGYGYRSIGGYHGGGTNTSHNSQQVGDIAVFMQYNRLITDDDQSEIFDYYKDRFGL